MNRLLMFVFSRRAVLRNDLSRSEVHAIRLNNNVFCLFFCVVRLENSTKS